MTALLDYAPVLDRLSARPAPRGWKAKCPAHEDRTPSLSLWLGRDGRLMLGCWAGCPKCAILAAAGLRWADLFPPQEGKRRRLAPMHIVAAYPYTDEFGEVLYETVRYEPKTFRQRRPAREGEKGDSNGFVWNLDVHDGKRVVWSAPRVLYRFPEITAAPPDRWLCVVGGEKDCESLRDIGVLGTTNVCGERSAWLPEYTQALAGRNVAVVPDNDLSGWRHAGEVIYALLPRCRAVRLLHLPGLPPKGDVTDWVQAQAGASVDEVKRRLWQLVNDSPQLR